MVPKIIVEKLLSLRGDDAGVRNYHTTIEICNCPTQYFYRPLRPSSEKYLKEVGETGSQLVREVFAIAGVDKVCIYPYMLAVARANAFEWEDIESQIVEALKKTFGDKANRVEVVFSEKEVPMRFPKKNFLRRLLRITQRLGWFSRKKRRSLYGFLRG